MVKLIILTVTVFVSTGFSKWLDWSLAPGGAAYAELKLASTPEEQARAFGGVAHPRTRLDSSQAYIAYHRYESAQELGLNYQKVSWQTDDWGFSAQIFDYEDFQGYDEFGRSTGDYASSMNDFGVHFQSEYSHTLWEIQLHYIDSRIAQAFSQGGYLMFKSQTRLGSSLNYGVLVDNLGGASAYDRRALYLPLTIQNGMSYSIDLTERINLVPAFDLKYVNEEGASIIISQDFWYSETLGLHLGLPVYQQTRASQYFPHQVGLSLALDFGKIQYAYQSQDLLSESHLLEVGIYF